MEKRQKEEVSDEPPTNPPMERDWNEDNPGPGAYHANYDPTLRSAPKPTFGLRTNIWFDYDRPGPGTYDVRRDGNASPKYTMGDRFSGPSGTNVPGPGTYHANFKHTNHKAPAYTMQGPNNYHPDQGIPGPGTYDLREELGGPAYSLGQRFNAKLNTNPGPGTYSPKTPSSAPAYSMGQHLFDSLPSGPGPGTYNLRSAEFSGPMFSMAKRFYRLRDKKRERRYSNALRQRPHPQGPHTRPATNSRGGTCTFFPSIHPFQRFFTFSPTKRVVDREKNRRF